MSWNITVIRSVPLILEMLLSKCVVQQQTASWVHDVPFCSSNIKNKDACEWKSHNITSQLCILGYLLQECQGTDTIWEATHNWADGYDYVVAGLVSSNVSLSTYARAMT